MPWGGAVAWPLVAHAQQAETLGRVGVLMNLSERDPEAQGLVGAFRDGLTKLGWIDGHNVRFDYRWSAGLGALQAVAPSFGIEITPDMS